MKNDDCKQTFLDRIKKGRRFEDWERAQWNIGINKSAVFEKSTEWKGKKGRVDIQLDMNDIGQFVLVEIKATDWENILPSRVKPNVLRHSRQLWRYIENALEEFYKKYPGSHDILSSEGIVPAMVYTNPPSDQNKKSLIEELLNDRGIQVVWREDYQSDL